MRCIEIKRKTYSKEIKELFNLNMRCIEIANGIAGQIAGTVFNLNMRCIEIQLNMDYKITKDKSSEELTKYKLVEKLYI